VRKLFQPALHISRKHDPRACGEAVVSYGFDADNQGKNVVLATAIFYKNQAHG